MKKNVTSITVAALMLAAGTIIWSCKKDSTTSTTTPSSSTPDTNTSTAQDHQTAENNSDDVEQMGAEGMDNGNINSNYRMGGGVASPMSGSVIITPNPTAKTLTITFSNYVGLDGHLRNGTIMYNWSASISSATHYRDSGLVISVTTPNNDYYVDSNKIQVNKTITNQGRITSGNLTWHVTTSLIITKANNGGTIQWSSTRDKVLLNTNLFVYNGSTISASFTGYINPINWAGAVVGVTGTASGISADGLSFTDVISIMLVRNFNCSPSLIHPHFHPYVAGEIDFTPSGKLTRKINFGTGACDETYTISIGSWSVTITYIW
jgi:hypothetical protein